MRKIYLFLIIAFAPSFVMANFFTADTVKFIGNELLGKPTNNSININLCAEKDIDLYVEYGTVKSSYPNKTSVQQAVGAVPFNVVLNNLQPSTKYYYRVQYKLKGTTVFIAKAERSFTTQKTRGKSFSFAIQADPHLDNNTSPELLSRSLFNVLEGNNDFMIDLGDNFMSEKESSKSYQTTLQRHLLLRSFYDLSSHSVPLFLVMGNHEGEQGSELNGTDNALPIWATKIRKMYYPNPVPDNFYKGNSKQETFVGLRENYYSFEWGDALFVVLDPYWNTLTKQGDNWRFSLGKEQYDWFNNVLETSGAKFKFVFIHQIVGGKDSQGRGGSDYAQYYEMGGQNADGSWGFTTQRKGWDLPLHQLMVKNKVNILFHGHDHFYVQQEKDGLTYQLVPQPGYPGNKSTSTAPEYGYLTGKILPSSGYLKVTVTDSTAKIDYIKAFLPSMETGTNKNGMVDYSYTIKSKSTVTSIQDNEEIPHEYELMQNYPNPFNPETVIRYQISDYGPVSLKVYDVLGREVATLVNEYKQPGVYNSEFSIMNYELTSGIYFYQLRAGSFVQTKKMIVIK